MDPEVQAQIDRRFELTRHEQGIAKDAIRDEVSAVRREVLSTHTTLYEAIRNGDEALTRHVKDQVVQIQVALDGARTATDIALESAHREMDQRFEAERRALGLMATDRDRERATFVESVSDRFVSLRAELTERMSGVRRELEASSAAAKEAVIKQEAATERRFEGVNEWRAQSADRERSQAEERIKLQASFMLKEVAETQFSQIRNTSDSRYEVLNKLLSQLTSRMDTMTGQDEGTTQAVRTRDTARTFVIGLVLAFAAVMTLVALVATATHGFTK